MNSKMIVKFVMHYKQWPDFN